MMMERGLGEIAKWTINLPLTTGAEGVGRALELAHLCERVAAGLREERLLCPATIEVGQWRDRSTDAFVSRPDVIGEIPAGTADTNLVSAVRHMAEEADASGQVYPTQITITGRGTILVPDGSQLERPDVLWLWADVDAEDCTLWLCSQSDAWLPRTLLGQPQPEVQALNAPRLERAMKAIERAVGAEWGHESHTRLAGMTRYGATNLGDPPDVYVPDCAHSATI